MRFLVGVLAMLLITNSNAYANWHEASSDHFVIYADQNPKTVKKFAEKLERFHAVMSLLFGREITKPSPSNRVTVFVVSNKSKVRKIHGGDNRFVAGFYRPRAGGTIAVVPRLASGGSKTALTSDKILLHEYAHHFMYSASARSIPRWFSEGFAEFFASTQFKADGSVIVGAPANHRGYELFATRGVKDVKAPLLLDSKAYLAQKTKVYDAFYGKSWLLYHYLFFSKERKGQQKAYFKYLYNGKEELEAAKLAFGDLSQLEKELQKYLKARRMVVFNLPSNKLKFGQVRMRELSKGEAEIMPVKIESQSGVTPEKAKKLVNTARKIAAKYPDNAAVQAAVAEAEFDAGNHQLAIDAANRALTLDAANVNAHVQKIFALRSMANDSENDTNAAALRKKLKKQIASLNRVENDHPIPLIQYYLTQVDQGRKPTDLAKHGVERALQLAPFDSTLRLLVCNQFMQDKKYDLAAAYIRPLAFSPHESDMTKAALVLLKKAEAKMEAKAENKISDAA